LFIRSHNDVFFADRNGDNTTQQANNAMILDLPDGPFINYQHIAFMDTTNDGDLLILNDRNSGGAGQDFFTVTNVIDTTGAAQTANFTFLPNADSSPFTPDTGAGWYDYDFDAASQTLALLDTSNRFVHVFQIGDAAASADVNGDEAVDGLDFLQIQRDSPSLVSLWQTQYGTGSSVPTLSQVPQPTTLALAACCLLGLCRTRRRGN